MVHISLLKTLFGFMPNMVYKNKCNKKYVIACEIFLRKKKVFSKS